MLHINNHEITGIYRGLQKIEEVYDYLYLAWRDLFMCCYANGYWIDDSPWVDDLSWKDIN